MKHASDLNRAVQVYVALIGACAFALAALSVATGAGDDVSGSLPAVGLLAAGILAAQWFPIHLTDKTKVYVDTTILIAAVLLLPPALAIATVSLASAIHELIARVSWHQGVFNVAQSVVYVGTGAWTIRALSEGSAGHDLIEARALAAAGAGIVVMHLVNTAAVATVAALQLGKPAPGFWLEGIWIDLPEHAVLAINGVLLAVAADSYPWLLPLLAGPLVLIYFSLRQSADLRATTRTMLQTIADLNQLLARDVVGVTRGSTRDTLQFGSYGFARGLLDIGDRIAPAPVPAPAFANRNHRHAGPPRAIGNRYPAARYESRSAQWRDTATPPAGRSRPADPRSSVPHPTVGDGESAVIS